MPRPQNLTPMAKPLTPPEALHRAAALCSSAEHCKADIHDKLTRWGISPADSRAIIDRLVQERFIDEPRYAIAFVKDKFRFSEFNVDPAQCRDLAVPGRILLTNLL